jgi:branched-chain amino acid transport system substrate-binding protein
MKSFFPIASLIVFFALPFAASSQEISSNAAKPRIGMLLTLSGQYSALGQDCKQGIELATSELGKELNAEFVYADSRADAAQAVVEFKKLVEVNKVSAVFAFRGPVGMAINPVSKTLKIPLLGGVSNQSFAASNDYAFQIWSKSDLEGSFIASILKGRGIKKTALFTVQDDYPVAVSTGFREKAGAEGIEIVFDSEILPTDNDFRSQILRLKQSEPELIFLNVGLNQIAPLLLQLRQSGITQPMLSNFWAGKKEVITAAGQAAEQLMFVEMSTDYPYFRSQLEQKFGSTPSGGTLSSYVATHMLALALKGRETITPEILNSRLSEVKEVVTPSGNFQVRDRVVLFPLILRTVREGKVQ